MRNKVINKFLRKKKVAILHVGRCGSSVISRMLNQNKDFFNSEEIFLNYHEKGRSFTKEEIESIISIQEQRKTSKIYAFETKYSSYDAWGGSDLSINCLNIDIENYLRILKNLKYDNLIILERKNQLNRIISILMGRKTGIWHQEVDSQKKNKIQLQNQLTDEVNNVKIGLLEYIDIMASESDRLIEKTKDFTVLNLTYEDHIEKNPLLAYDMICDFLKISNPVSPEIKLQKTNRGTVKDKIINYEEIHNYMKGSKHEWMLTE